MATDPALDDIPGTYVFTTQACRQGYRLNKFCKSLDVESNRESFRSDPDAYLDQFKLSDEQRRVIEERDWLGMLKIGGNIYYTFKLCIFDGLSMQHVGGLMSDMTVEDFRQMMMDGGRPVAGNTSKKENNRNG
ncbi:MAG: protocatechuate 4,5-dioxygenase subunit alpha [Alphaproteobacteria bacterium]